MVRPLTEIAAEPWTIERGFLVLRKALTEVDDEDVRDGTKMLGGKSTVSYCEYA